eukprot:9617487-Ditylum_brightwellii.AAC.1
MEPKGLFAAFVRAGGTFERVREGGGIVHGGVCFFGMLFWRLLDVFFREQCCYLRHGGWVRCVIVEDSAVPQIVLWR